MKPRVLTLLIAVTTLAGPRALAEAEGAAAPMGEAPEVERVVIDESVQAPTGRVERSLFTRAVVEREPQETITALSNDQRRVYYFTELRDLQGETVTHRWEFDGKVMAEVAFDVEGPRWRVYSSKELEPSWLGEWTVSVIDSSGRVLASDTLSYQEAPAGGTSATAVRPPAGSAPAKMAPPADAAPSGATAPLEEAAQPGQGVPAPEAVPPAGSLPPGAAQE